MESRIRVMLGVMITLCVVGIGIGCAGLLKLYQLESNLGEGYARVDEIDDDGM